METILQCFMVLVSEAIISLSFVQRSLPQRLLGQVTIETYGKIVVNLIYDD